MVLKILLPSLLFLPIVSMTIFPLLSSSLSSCFSFLLPPSLLPPPHCIHSGRGQRTTLVIIPQDYYPCCLLIQDLLLSCVQLISHFSTVQDLRPRNGFHLNAIKTIPSRHARRTTSQVTLDDQADRPRDPLKHDQKHGHYLASLFRGCSSGSSCCHGRTPCLFHATSKDVSQTGFPSKHPSTSAKSKVRGPEASFNEA